MMVCRGLGERGEMNLLNAQSLPWYLIGVLVSALLTVFYSLLRGKILSSRVSDRLLQSTESVRSLVDSVGKLMVLAENQDKVLKALHQRGGRGDTRGRGGTS
jgi:hypothetical protein